MSAPQIVAHGGAPVRVFRDVKVTFHDVPLWGVNALFNLVHNELGKPNLGDVEVTLTIDYSSLDESKYEQVRKLVTVDLFANGICEITKVGTREVTQPQNDGGESE